MNALGYYPWCNKCWTFVSGGFGYTDENGEHKFECITCAMKDAEERKLKTLLKEAQDKQKERV